MSSDDWWRHNSPWPGHDRQPPGHAPGEQPPGTAPWGTIVDPPSGGWGGGTGAGSSGGGAAGGYTGAYTGGYSSTGCLGVVALVTFVTFFAEEPRALPLLAALYPLVAVIEIGAMRGAFVLAGKLAPSAPTNTRLAIAVAACLVLLWPASRLEQRLASFAAYRVVRHIARLALVGLFVYQLTSLMPPAQPLPAWMRAVRGLFQSPAQLATVVGAVVAMHFLLRNFLGVRSAWRRLLEFTRLRHA
jgi:hypothetical protein